MIPEPPKITQAALAELRGTLPPGLSRRVAKAARLWAGIKQGGGTVVVATGSGPHLHEGVTALIAGLVELGLVDGVLTSSAVVGHEMAGSLERVRRVDGRRLGLDPGILPVDGKVEVALLSPERLSAFQRQVEIDLDHYRRLLAAPGREIIKVAGNLAYPTGLWLEQMAARILPRARERGLALEAAAGPACHPLTMLGACARQGVPCLVTVPQLVGAGRVGLCVGDSLPVSRRSELVADLLARADLIVESGLALSQEIHDGPFELFTGHGLWSHWQGGRSFSLRDKALVRIDLDPQLERAWQAERRGGKVGRAIDRGLPKAVSLGLPFRMEMSGFARLPGSLPLTGDLGAIWPVLASRLVKELGVKAAFMCYKQGTPLGEAVRNFVVKNVTPLDPEALPSGVGAV